MLKRISGWVLSLICISTLVFAGCSSGSSDSNLGLLIMAQGSSSSGATAAPEKFKENQIVKNKVVDISGENKLVEYFEFTSETAGNYSLYENGAKITSYNSVDIPATFTYDYVSGKFTVGNSSSYAFNTVKAGKKVSVIASELMTTTDAAPKFTSEWAVLSGVKYVFNEESKTVNVNNNRTLKYTNDAGWITVGSNVPFFWDTVKKNFYYLAYETERSVVEAVGRGSADADIVFTSPVFIYSALNK